LSSPEELLEALGSRFEDGFVARDEVTVIGSAETLVADLEALKADKALSFDFFADVSATDWPGRDPRFWVAYHLLSLKHNHRLRIKVGVSESDPHLPTVTGVFPGAEFMERELYDMLGVIFDGHPDLRRILLPEDWDIHPHRKDYELGGVKTQYKGGAFIPPVDQRLR